MIIALVTHWSRIGYTLVTQWSRIGHTLVTHWSDIGHALVTHWSRIGHVLMQYVTCTYSCSYTSGVLLQNFRDRTNAPSISGNHSSNAIW